MKKTLIDRSNCTNLSLVLHAIFHSRMYRLLDEWGKENRHQARIPDTMMEEWQRLSTLENDLCKEAKAAFETLQLARIDAERNAVITYLFGALRLTRYRLEAELREAGQRLILIIRPHRGLQRRAKLEKANDIKSLTDDLRKPTALADIRLLGLEPILQQLEERNEAYKAMRHLRSDKRVNQRLPPAHEVRPQADAIYRRACLLLESCFLYDPSLADSLSALAQQINAVIEDTKIAHRQRTLRRKKLRTQNS